MVKLVLGVWNLVENVKLSDFLVEESIVKTKLQKSSDWIQNVVYKLFDEKEELLIALDDNGEETTIYYFSD